MASVYKGDLGFELGLDIVFYLSRIIHIGNKLPNGGVIGAAMQNDARHSRGAGRVVAVLQEKYPAFGCGWVRQAGTDEQRLPERLNHLNR